MNDLWTISWPNLWAAPAWIAPAAVLAGVSLLLIGWSYHRSPGPRWVRLGAAAAKAAAVVLLALILIEPMRSDVRPVPGANLFVVLADNSQSLQVRDRGEEHTRAEALKELLAHENDWQVRLGQDFDVRRFTFASAVQPVADFSEMLADGTGSSIALSLENLARRYRGRPNAGVLLLTDGNSTDMTDDSIDWSNLPPIYPVVIGGDESQKDISITRVSVSQTNFEAAPVIVSAEITASGYAGETIVCELLDSVGKRLERQTVRNVEDDRPFALRFQVKPTERGILFYEVRTFAESEEEHFDSPDENPEATLANNRRLVMVDRGGGPYRVLYVSGRPNWEFKFLRRALSEDDEVQLVGLIRIAKREPKFKFRDRDDGSNPIFRGFGSDEEQAEQYDEPVIVRLGTENPEELRDGFPKAADQLFGYHAIVLDDVEADFFTQDQKSLIQQFVSQRGGGLLMLGGQESFLGGGYDRTAIGEMLPVYVGGPSDAPEKAAYRLVLTREGWLEPWVRVRSTEAAETKRLSEMPAFRTLNRISSIKPGATVLARVSVGDGKTLPALVVQRFGKGRSAALLVGDMWRWQLRKKTSAGDDNDDDLQKAWRQMMRWLVADVPRRIEVDVRRRQDDPNQPVELDIKIRDEMYKSLEGANIIVEITTPDAKKVTLTAKPIDEKSGRYAATYLPRTPGGYRADIIATAADGSEIGRRQTGWVSQPAVEEFRTLRPNVALLERIAERTGGEVLRPDELDRFVAELHHREIPVTEPTIDPVWHKWLVFMLVVGLLVGEWGLRRWKGLP